MSKLLLVSAPSAAGKNYLLSALENENIVAWIPKPLMRLLEDILTLDYPIQYLKLVPSTIDLVSLTSPVIHSITIPHSCITIKTTDIGSTLSIHIQQCFPFLQIEQGYQLVFRSPILTINNRFITEPIPIYFYITGCMILFFFFSHI